jgi:LysR family transcriptional activator of nhaA
MRHLNYNHLLYFWTVAREGSIAKATEVLHLTPQTISVQLKILEESVGEPLFSRAGRGLVLTEFGHLVFQYADEIFSIGEELCVRLKSKDASMAPSLQVGITNSIPKLIAMRILQPALEGDEPIKLICKEGSLESLLGGLAVHQLDMIISDCAIPAGLNVKAYSHALGNSDIGFFAKTTNARRYIKDFPRSLNNAPLLLPTTLVAEFEDSALMKAFGEEGLGVFPSPEVIQDEIETMYKCRMLGKADSVREYYYAISPERKLKHPIVLEIIEAARDNLFGS